MYFILGYIGGIVTAALIFIILAFFRAGIEKRVRIIETHLGNAGPKVKGAIFLPDDEATEERNKIIVENNKNGVDTKISDLL